MRVAGRASGHPMDASRRVRDQRSSRRGGHGGTDRPSAYGCAVPGLPSLELLAEEAAAELAAQERRGDALDSKAAVLLGFSGVLVALTASNLKGGTADAAAVAAGLAAPCAGAAFVPRSFPFLELRRLRDSYLTSEEDFTRLSLLDTRIAMYSETEAVLTLKALLVSVASIALGLTVVLAVIASTLGD